MSEIAVRLRSLVRGAHAAMARWESDILAIAAIACIAIGLSMISAALSWLAVGAFLLVAAGAPRRDGA